MRKINNASVFQCPTCRCQNQMEERRDDLQLERGVFANEKQLLNLGDPLESQGGVKRAVKMRVCAA